MECRKFWTMKIYQAVSGQILVKMKYGRSILKYTAVLTVQMLYTKEYVATTVVYYSNYEV